MSLSMNVKNEKFWQLLKPVHPQAEAFCRKLAGNRDDGDDLYQDALLKALESFDSLKDARAFKAWLYRILINIFKNRRRRQSLVEFVQLKFLTADDRRTDDPSLRYVLNRQLEHALGVLSPEDRALVLMFELEGFSIGELTEITGRPGGTIKARLSRARGKMRRFLQKKLKLDEKTATENEVRYALQRSKTVDE